VERARNDLIQVLREARALLAVPDNDFVWSGWEDGATAFVEMDRWITDLENGAIPRRLDLAVLFAPTGPIQEVSLSSGWGLEFLALASRFDAAAERFYTDED
jgi:hypothetical protein